MVRGAAAFVAEPRHPADPLSFAYASAWLAQPGATPLHPGMPLSGGAIDSPYVAAFFENLLPEGEQRREITSITAKMHARLCNIN
jgi:HipA-like protein